MQNLDEVFVIAILAISGILFFTFLDLSLKCKKKFLKICCVIVAGICSIVLMESIRILISTQMTEFVDKISFILIRIIQWLLGIVTILMSLSVIFDKRERLA